MRSDYIAGQDDGAALVLAAKSGDGHPFEILIERYQPGREGGFPFEFAQVDESFKGFVDGDSRYVTAQRSRPA